MTLPEPVASYIEAANAGDGQRTSTCFAESAVVHDESADHRGRQAIRAWVEETTRKYHSRLEALGTRTSEGHTLVTCRVTGDFPGSPVELDFDFELVEGKIVHLRIE